jgi:predicted MFS family arabinose efflux permease
MVESKTDNRSRIVMTRCFIAAAAGTCAASATSWMQPVLMHDLVAQRGMGEIEAGGVLTTEGLAMGFASMFIAHFVTRGRAQAFAIGGMLLSILASAVSLVVASDLLLFVSRFGVGIGLGATIMVSNIVAANFADPDKTYARVGLINLAFGALAITAYSQLLKLYPAATPYLFLMLTFICFLPLMALLPKLDLFDHAGTQLASQGVGMSASMKKRASLLSVITFIVAIVSGIIWALYALIGEQAGLSLQQINDAIALSIFTGFAGMLLPAVIGSRAGRTVPFIFGLATLTVAIIVLASHPSAYWYRVAVCANVAAIYFILPYLSGAAARIDGGGNAAAYVSGAFFFANSAAPLLAGTLIATVGIGFLAILIVAITAVAASIFVYVERLSDEADRVRGSSAVPAPSEEADMEEGLAEPA